MWQRVVEMTNVETFENSTVTVFFSLSRDVGSVYFYSVHSSEQKTLTEPFKTF